MRNARSIMNVSRGIVAGLAGALAMASASSAAPVRWGPGVGGNGHYYDLVAAPTAYTWLDAFGVASTMQFLGVFGDLATTTSAAELQFVTDSFGDQISGGAWLGGYQFANLVDPADGWNWVTNETWAFTAWAPGEPNDNGGFLDETYLQLLPGEQGWNDLDVKTGLAWYVVEYAVVPGPGSVALAFAGLTLAMGRPGRRS